MKKFLGKLKKKLGPAFLVFLAIAGVCFLLMLAKGSCGC